MSTNIEFKARALSLTTVIIPSHDISLLSDALEKKLNHSPQDFFTTTAMVADLSRVGKVDEQWLDDLKTCFKNYELILVGLTAHHFESTILKKHHLASIPTASRQSKPAVEVKSVAPEEETVPPPSPAPSIAPPENKVIRGNIRSGQRIYAAGGDLIVIGNVSAGAEVIADGNVHVFGNLRGRAFAGARGNESCHIFASNFSGELVSIAGSYQNMEQLEPYKNGKNCLITLNKDETMLIVSL